MSIVSNKKGTLVDRQIPGKVEDKTVKNPSETISVPQAESQNKGFFRSTIQELRKVEWPSLGYTLRWSLVIILFTTFMSLGMGFFENTFEAGTSFIDCTSPKSRNTSIQSCGTEFVRKFTFQ